MKVGQIKPRLKVDGVATMRRAAVVDRETWNGKRDDKPLRVSCRLFGLSLGLLA
jgi:hypothetical protein